LFPLKDEKFEGISVKVPHEPASILAEEYGKKSLTNTRFHWYAIAVCSVCVVPTSELISNRHRFNKASKIWEPE
jgi:hypothetical protein